MTDAKEATAVATAPPEFSHTLTDGRVATMLPGKGKHAQQASKICNGDQSLFIPALLSQLCKVNGAGLPMEEFLEMDLKDYMALAAEVGGNFI